MDSRTKDIFSGMGDKNKRKNYLLNRFAFVSAMFGLMGMDKVTLFRGMATEDEWTVNRPRFFSSWTFSQKVAESFSQFESNDNSKHSYLLKRTLPTSKLFMTYIETHAMNNQYAEIEAVVLHDLNDERLW